LRRGVQPSVSRALALVARGMEIMPPPAHGASGAYLVWESRIKFETGMENRTTAISDDGECTGRATDPCVLDDFKRAIGGKWKLEIPFALMDGAMRFGALRRSPGGITQHVLSAQLREVERDGLVCARHSRKRRCASSTNRRRPPAACCQRSGNSWPGRKSTPRAETRHHMQADTGTAGTGPGTANRSAMPTQ
jgi:DNA-binding HxlR family transcriptional regulator